MKACVMCGGLGTRLRPLTLERPKPLIPLLNKPSVVHLIEHLRGEGVTDVVMTLGYLGEMIEEAVSDIEGVDTTCVYEKSALGTAGGVRHAREHLKDGTFMVVGGDHVLDLQLNRIYRFHEQSDAIVTIGLICIDNPFEYGVCDMDARNVIHRFLEKPDPGEAFSNLINTGVYVCNPEILDWIPDVPDWMQMEARHDVCAEPSKSRFGFRSESGSGVRCNRQDQGAGFNRRRHNDRLSHDRGTCPDRRRYGDR